jgi:MraZ protein
VFLSSITNNLDAKGRLSVPASFRSHCSDSGFEGVVLWPSLDGAFLEGGDVSVLALLSGAGESLKFGMKSLMRRAARLCAKRRGLTVTG